jgi:hypothetical protein
MTTRVVNKWQVSLTIDTTAVIYDRNVYNTGHRWRGHRREKHSSLFVRSFSDDEKSFIGFRLDGLLVVGDDDGAEGGVLGVHLRSRLQNFFLCNS